MGKGEGLPFQPLELFDIGVRYSEEVLRGDGLLKGLGREAFVRRLSVSYNNFNILHPFREGNGRTQRIFWEIIAREAGWHFDWGLIDKRTNDRASIAGMQRNDLRPLEDMFRRIVKPLSEPLTMSNDRPILVNMRNRRTRHTTCLSSSAVTCTSITPTNAPSSPQGKESRNAGTGQDDFRMRRAGIHCLGIWFSVFCSFSIPVFRFFSVFTVSGIRSGEGIGSRPAVGCLTYLSVAAADAATLRRAGLFRLMPFFTGFVFQYFVFSVSR